MVQATTPLSPIGRGGNARGQIVPTTSSSMFAGAGQALATAGEGLGRIAAEEMRKREEEQRVRDMARDNVTAVRAEGEFLRAAQEKVDELDPMSPTYLKDVEGVYRELRDEWTGEQSAYQFATPEGQALLARVTEAQTQNAIANAAALADETIKTQQLQAWGQAADATLASIRQDPDGYDDYLAGLQSQSQLLTVGMNPADVAAQAEVFADSALLARIEGLAEAGRIDEARAFLKENEGSLDQQVAISAAQHIRGVESRKQQEFLAATANRVADLGIRIIDARDPVTLGALRAEVDGLRAQGFFEGREQTAVGLIAQIEAKRQQLIAIAENTTDILQRYGSGMGVNDRTEAQVVWDHAVQNIPEGADPLPYFTDVVRQGGRMPEKFYQMVENAELVDHNPELLAQAALLHDAARAGSDTVDTGAGDRVSAVSAYVAETNVPYQDAAQWVVDNAPDAATLQRRNEEFETVFAQDGNTFSPEQALLEGGMFGQETLGGLSRLFGDVDPYIPPAIANDYTAALKLRYAMTGSPEVATAAVNREFQQRYGISTVGGLPQIVEMPPERNIEGLPPNVAANVPQEAITSLLDEATRRALAQIGVRPAIVVGAEDTEEFKRVVGRVPVAPEGAQDAFDFRAVYEGVTIDASGIPAWSWVADARTAQDGSYELRVRNSEGILASIYNERTGQPIRIKTTWEELTALPGYAERVEPILDRAGYDLQRINNGGIPWAGGIIGGHTYGGETFGGNTFGGNTFDDLRAKLRENNPYLRGQ